jgi:hypothetical protein
MPLPAGLAVRALTARVSADLAATGVDAAGLGVDGALALDVIGLEGLGLGVLGPDGRELDGSGLDGPGIDGLDVLAPDGLAAGGVGSDALGADRPAPEAFDPAPASPRFGASSRPRRTEPLPRLLLLRAMADPLGLVDVRRSEDGMRGRSDAADGLA